MRMKLEDVHIARSALTGRVYIGTVRQVEGGLLEWRSKVDRTDEFDELAKEERTEARAECLREVLKEVDHERHVAGYAFTDYERGYGEALAVSRRILQRLLPPSRCPTTEAMESARKWLEEAGQ
jgi:hypothetical protein